MYKYVLMFLLGGICAYMLSLIFQPNAKISKSAENKAEAIVLNCRRQFIPDTDYIPDVRQRQLVYQSNECIKKELVNQIKKIFPEKKQQKILSNINLLEKANLQFYSSLYTENKYVLSAGTLELLLVQTSWEKTLQNLLTDAIFQEELEHLNNKY